MPLRSRVITKRIYGLLITFIDIVFFLNDKCVSTYGTKLSSIDVGINTFVIILTLIENRDTIEHICGGQHGLCQSLYGKFSVELTLTSFLFIVTVATIHI